MRNLIQAFGAGIAGAVTVVLFIGASSIKTDGNVETDQQLVSNVLRGTPPLSVQSPDRVANLNADMLDGEDSSAFASASDTYTMAEVDSLLATYRDSRRAFYLTDSTHGGGPIEGVVGPLDACGTGYHMASLWEIAEPSALRYAWDHPNAYTRPDSGDGPPSGLGGWVRTGYTASVENVPGRGNCSGWATTSGWGTGALIPSDWSDPSEGIYALTWGAPWGAAVQACNLGARVWCVEDAPGSGTTCEPEDTEPLCQDGIDNDCDSYIDCDDFDCSTFCP